MKILYLIFILIIFSTESVKHKKSGVTFDNPMHMHQGWVYHGKLLPDMKKVVMNPKIKAVPVKNISHSEQICGFYVHHNSGSGTAQQFPFLVVMETDINKGASSAAINLKPGLTTEMLEQSKEIEKPFVFQIEALDCDTPPHFSEKKYVVIDIVSEMTPKFTQEAYHFSLKTSQFLDGTSIGQVVAFERPIISSRNSRQGICKYEIINNPSFTLPFSIDNQGNIQVSLPSNNDKPIEVIQYYKFLVKATDCNLPNKKSVSVPVTIDIFDPCTPQWTGLPKKPLEYSIVAPPNVLPLLYTTTSHKPTHPFLHLCSSTCHNVMATVTARLQGEKLKPASSKQCVLTDLNKATQQSKLCGASSKLLTVAPDHLARPYTFDGSNYFELDALNGPPSQLGDVSLGQGHHQLQQFHVMFWMKHGQMNNGGAKEQIFCRSDAHRLNRHHTSIFLHNCKIIFLMRHEHQNNENAANDKNQLYPSEWRFGPFNEVCDNEWHHFSLAVSMEMVGNSMHPLVELMIDGERSAGHQEQLDDKELHGMLSEDSGTRTMIGACYHSRDSMKSGSNSPYVQYFIGQLAHLRINPMKIEKPNTVRCMATCGETLLLPHVVEKIDNLSYVTLLSDTVKISSKSITSLLQILSSLSYLDAGTSKERDNTIGLTRFVSLETDIKCKNGQVLKIPTYSIPIVRTDTISNEKSLPTTPTISINIKQSIDGEPKKLIYFLKNIQLISSFSDDTRTTLESCIVRPMDHIFQSWEYLTWPVTDALDLHLSGLNNSHGLIIEGKANYKQYQRLLSKIAYVDSKNEFIKRRLAVICSVDSKEVTQQKDILIYIKPMDRRTYHIIDDPMINNDKTGDDSFKVNAKLNGNLKVQEMSHLKKDFMNHQNSYSIWLPIVFGCFGAILIGSLIAMFVYRKRQSRHKGHRSTTTILRRNRPHIETNNNQSVQNNNFQLNIINNPLICDEIEHKKYIDTSHELLDDMPPSCDNDISDDDDDNEKMHTSQSSSEPTTPIASIMTNGRFKPRLVLPPGYMEQFQQCTV